jgi:hypothetical protein
MIIHEHGRRARRGRDRTAWFYRVDGGYFTLHGYGEESPTTTAPAAV